MFTNFEGSETIEPLHFHETLPVLSVRSLMGLTVWKRPYESSSRGRRSYIRISAVLNSVVERDCQSTLGKNLDHMKMLCTFMHDVDKIFSMVSGTIFDVLKVNISLNEILIMKPKKYKER